MYWLEYISQVRWWISAAYKWISFSHFQRRNRVCYIYLKIKEQNCPLIHIIALVTSQDWSSRTFLGCGTLSTNWISFYILFHSFMNKCFFFMIIKIQWLHFTNTTLQYLIIYWLFHTLIYIKTCFIYIEASKILTYVCLKKSSVDLIFSVVFSRYRMKGRIGERSVGYSLKSFR